MTRLIVSVDDAAHEDHDQADVEVADGQVADGQAEGDAGRDAGPDEQLAGVDVGEQPERGWTKLTAES